MKNTFFDKEIEVALKILNTTEKGLTTKEANVRIKKFGKNVLPQKKKDSIFKLFFMQLNSPMTFILIIAVILSLSIGETVDAFFIIFVILIDCILGTVQEWRASKSADALKKLIQVENQVLRDGKEIVKKAELLVPGDIVLLTSGDKVSADMRIISAHNLKIDESTLTGESIAQTKHSNILAAKIPLAGRKNMAFAGTTVTSGRAVCVVTETGSNTEFGLIASKVIEEKDTSSPLTIRMEKFSKQLALIFSVIAVILTMVLYYKGFAPKEIFFSVVALSVSAIPEGLTVSMTLALSVASSRMAKRNVLVKKLNSVESLGSCTIIASDKTGTLTVNEQTAKIVVLSNGKSVMVDGSGYAPIGKVETTDVQYIEELKRLSTLGALNNEAHLDIIEGKWVGTGDSIDIAFLSLSGKLDINYNQERTKVHGSIPYESEQKYSAVFYENEKNYYCTVKGSVEKVLGFCKDINIFNEKEELTKESILELNNKLASEGYRVIALAYGKKRDFQEKEIYDSKDIPSLTFAGLVGFIDPIRKEAKGALKKAAKAGIKTIMITGDHPLTSRKIAYDLNLISNDDEVTDGSELEEMYKKGPFEFDTFVKSKTIFSRVTPTDKYHIVESLKRQGEFVAVTGDGVNDALAMKAANIGVAIGSGTEVAKETGSMIITDDDFSSIVSGIEEGRIAYNNVRNVIYLLLSCAVAEVLFFMLAIILNYPIPLLAIQLLWLNLVTDGIQDCALAFEKGHGTEMSMKPRNPKESVFDPLLLKELAVSGIYIGLLVFGLWIYLIDYLNFEVSYARSYILLLMVFVQNVHAFNCRSERESIFKLRIKDNYFLIISVILVLILQFIVTEVEFLSNIIGAHAIPVEHVVLIFLAALPILVIMEIFKYFVRRKEGKKAWKLK